MGYRYTSGMLGGSQHVYQTRRQKREVYEALVTWIRDLKDWSHFASLTILNRKDGSAPGMQASWKIAEAFSKKMRSYGADAYLVEERGNARDRLHWHALLRLPEKTIDERPGDWADMLWQQGRNAGFTKIEAVANKTAVTRYVTKYTNKDLENRWIIN